jgi:hypothetical protein
MFRRFTPLFAVLCSAAPAYADEIVLANGSVLTGEARREGEVVHVALDIGTVTFAKDEVKEIRESETELAELERRRARLRPDDAAGHRELAAWAESRGLETQARALWQRVLDLAPTDARAHEKLGHRQHQGRWLDEDEYMRARGYTRHFGEWLTADQLKAREREAAERRERAREEAERRLAAREPEPEAQPEPRHDDVEPYLEYFAWAPWMSGPLYFGSNPYYVPYPLPRSVPSQAPRVGKHVGRHAQRGACRHCNVHTSSPIGPIKH